MPRLRTLNVATADGPRDILILDKLDTLGQFQTDVERRKEAGLPPILMFDYEVDLPETGTAATA